MSEANRTMRTWYWHSLGVNGWRCDMYAAGIEAALVCWDVMARLLPQRPRNERP